MASAFTHAFFASAIGTVIVPSHAKLVAIGALFAVLPDADVVASHGLLDALTNGGLGVAFFAPFSNERVFFPWRPIAVSPIAVRSFFSHRGLRILANEFFIVWIPSIAVALGALAFRYSRKNRAL
ncbi:MAG: metal-dependent hydrolase [Polyangiaceae bacterium]